MKTKKLLLAAAAFISYCLLPNSSHGQTWTHKTGVFGGFSRVDGVGFSIGTKGYFGTGSGSKKDFWEWDQATDAWTQKADFAGGQRELAVGISIGTKGYVGLGQGFDAFFNPIYNSDWWEFDPAANTWTAKTAYPATRERAFGFTIGSLGYVGGGSRNNGITYTDFYEYNPAGAGTWTAKTSGTTTIFKPWSYGVSIGTKGYVCAEAGATGVALTEWDQTANTWTPKATLTAATSSEGAIFAIGTKIYYGWNTGFWVWDKATNTWTASTAFPGPFQVGTERATFTIGCKGYFATPDTPPLWEFDDGTCALPITLLTFTANCTPPLSVGEGPGVRINWSTATEINNDYFTIERSTSPDPSKGGALNWEVAGTVKGAGNSSTVRSYKFIDNQVLPFGEDLGGVVYYRLKQTDYDGKTEIFNNNLVAVDVTECAVKVFPNPAGNTLHVPYVAEQDGEVTLQVYDVIGKLVKEKLVAAIKGNNKFTLDLTTVAQGMYVLRIKGGVKESNQKFVKQ